MTKLSIWHHCLHIKQKLATLQADMCITLLHVLFGSFLKKKNIDYDKFYTLKFTKPLHPSLIQKKVRK